MNNFYIAKVNKKDVKNWFDNNIWSENDMTSILVQKDNGKFVQIFAAKGGYGKIGSDANLYSADSHRFLGSGRIISYVESTIITNINGTYVMK